MITLKTKHFELFKKECQAWLKKLGLMSWEVHYRFKKLEGNLAACSTKYKGRTATMFLAPKWENIEQEELIPQIKQSALHECLELLISPLGAMAGDRSWIEDDYTKEEHMVIRTLEKLLI